MFGLGGYTGQGGVRGVGKQHVRGIAALLGAIVAFGWVVGPVINVGDEFAKRQAQRDLEAFLSSHPYDIEQEEYAREHRDREAPEYEEAKSEDPQARMMQEYLLMIDPVERTLPIERLHAANRMATQQRRLRKGQVSSWTERGPSNVGGRTRAIMFDPNDPTNKKVWAGGVSGGLWLTNDITNDNEPWSNVDDFWANIAISSITYDPTSPTTFYVGTGEGWFNIGSQQGAGIFKSTDGGLTWNQLPSTTNETFHHVQDIVVTDAGTVLATTRDNGVVQRSTDGGQTWTKVISGKRGTDLEIGPNGAIYVAKGMFSGGLIWRSNDDGLTWTLLNPGGNGIPDTGIQRIELAAAPSDSNRVYALVTDNNNTVFGLYRSFDAGSNWESIPLPQDCDQGIPTNDIGRGQGWYDLAMTVNPTDEDEVIIGAINLFRTTSAGGSVNWTQIGVSGHCSGVSRIHSDHHVALYRPGGGGDVVFGHDGGITYTPDVAQTPTSFVNRNQNYNVTQFYSVALGPDAGSNLLVGGTQDNGTPKMVQAGLALEDADVTGGDGGFVQLAHDGSQIGMASNQFLRWYRTLDGGNSFDYVGGISSGGSFINPSDLDEDTHHLFFNYDTERIGRLNNLDSNPVNWDLLGPPGGFGAKVSHVRNSEFAPPATATVFLGTRSGSIWKVDGAEDGGTPSWTEINTTPLPAAAVSSIELSGSEDRLIVTFSNYGVESVWMTDDAGSSWTDLDTGRGLPDMPVWWILLDPGNSDRLIAGTEAGLWTLPSISTGSSWQADPEIPTTRVAMLDYRTSDGRLAAATHGRGLWSTTLSAETTPHLALTALLEGAYAGEGNMETSTAFSNAVPTEQPYALEGQGPVDEADSGSITVVPDDMVDWVLVSLRSGPDPETEIAGSVVPALLRNDGSITAADGGLIGFDGLPTGSYYIVLEHRNHIPVMSSQPVDFSTGIGGWDFTAGQDKAYGTGSDRMAALGDGKTGLFAGDATADGQVTANDFNTFLAQTKAAMEGYIEGDFNLDGQVTATDFNIFLANSKSAAVSYVP